MRCCTSAVAYVDLAATIGNDLVKALADRLLSKGVGVEELLNVTGDDVLYVATDDPLHRGCGCSLVHRGYCGISAADFLAVEGILERQELDALLESKLLVQVVDLPDEVMAYPVEIFVVHGAAIGRTIVGEVKEPLSVAVARSVRHRRNIRLQDQAVVGLALGHHRPLDLVDHCTGRILHPLGPLLGAVVAVAGICMRHVVRNALLNNVGETNVVSTDGEDDDRYVVVVCDFDELVDLVSFLAVLRVMIREFGTNDVLALCT